MEVHQILPSIAPGDAVSDECLSLQELLQKAGHSSRIYAENIHPALAGRVLRYTHLKSSPQDLILFHYSIGSDITDVVRKLPGRKIMRYHNITPHQYMAGCNDQLMYLCKKGRDDLRSMPENFLRCLCDSGYNAEELRSLGYADVSVVPVLVDLRKYDSPPLNPDIMREYGDGHTILYVAKIAPHKCQLEAIEIFYYLKKYIDKSARLVLVGSYDGFEPYYRELENAIKELGVGDVIFTGKVSFRDIVSYYRASSVFLCPSHHEGFCVPLLEAMHFQLPIVAYNGTAIPNTLGGAGVLYHGNQYQEAAELISLLMSDADLRIKIINGQNERIKAFDFEETCSAFVGLIKSLAREG